MTERVRRAEECAPFIPLPHPAWRVRMWMAKNPWFEAELLPTLRRRVRRRRLQERLPVPQRRNRASRPAFA